jgi:peptidoglycan/xylan/chitin deacetylase (PgdA/CDA1 family)
LRRTYPILMYHRIDAVGGPSPPGGVEEKRYAVDLGDFSRQMLGIKRAGYRGVSLGRALAPPAADEDDRDRRVVITFDDGYRSDYEYAFPVLAANGFTATFFITGDRIGRPEGPLEHQIRGLCAAGMEIGAHGMTHRFLSGLSPVEQEDECRRSRDILSGITGSPVRFFSLPGGRSSAVTFDILKTLSYAAVCTSVFGYNRWDGDSFRLKRIPITGSTSDREFHGYLQHSPRVIYPSFAAAFSRELVRRVLGERLYLAVRGRLIRE